LNVVVLCLAVAHGVVVGAVSLAGEKEDATLAFLDGLSSRRGPLWGRKLAAGALLTLSQSAVLAALAAGLGFGTRTTLTSLPLLALDALAWGLLGGALCGRVLTAVLIVIPVMAASVFLFTLPDHFGVFVLGVA